VAAVSLVSRTRRPSHGTFAVVMKVDAYREVFRDALPRGFFPAAENPDASVPFDRWVWYDTGDLATQAVRDAGWEVKLLHRDHEGLLVRFHGITLSRRGAEHVGGENLVHLAGRDRYFFRGYAGNLALRALHDRLFPAGPPYGFPLARGPLLRESLKNPPRELAWRLGYIADLERGARRVAAFAES
jgi:ribulose bisphosphate carboxylase small subunit